MKKNVTKISKGETLRRLVRHTPDQTYILASGAHLLLCAIITNVSKKENKIDVRLMGADARVDIIFLYIGKRTDHLRLSVMVRHGAMRSIARIWGRSILFDNARSDIRGMCEIQKKAVHADTYFSHHALLLSPYARALAIPSLEILADDVKAGHAATAGPFAQEAVVYLRSRGISSATAKKLLVKGFLTADIPKIPEAVSREKFEHLVHTITGI